MLDIPAIRRENLQKIRDKSYASNAELARAIGRSSSFVQAGNFTNTGDDSFDEWIDVPEDMPDGSYGLKIRGKSMEPAFYQGEIVVIDPTLSANPGDFVVARIANSSENEATIKQYAVTGIDRNGVETFELRPLNPLFPTFSSKEHDIDLLGVVVEKRIKMR